MPHINIRNYKDKDYESVKRNLEEGSLFEPHWDSRETLQRMIAQDPESILVAEKDGEVVGNVYIIRFWEAHIFRLAVKKNHRNQGIGTLLLKAAEEKMKERGIEEYELYFEADNKELEAFYRERGFQGSEKRYRCMWKKL